MDPPVLSFYGAEPVPLPSRFAHIKRRLAEGHHAELKASWLRLLAALEQEVEHIHANGPALIPSISLEDVADDAAVSSFRQRLQRCGVGVIRGVVASGTATAWVEETRDYVRAEGCATVTPPAPYDPTCYNYFWSPAQVRARAHPNVLRAMRFAMGLWATGTSEENEAPRLSTRFPICYADRIRIHADADANVDVDVAAQQQTDKTLMAQVDGGSLERWEPDGYGRAGTYDCVFSGRWEEYDPWDPAGRVDATPDLYNGAGSCSIFRMFQGLLALTDVAPGVIRLLPSPKLAAAYFLLRPLFRETADGWEMDESTIIHGAVPGHAQRVTDRWHPHLQLPKSLVALPRLHAGDYIVWHCDTAYTIEGGEKETSETEMMEKSEAQGKTDKSNASNQAAMMVYLPACPLTQTNALYLARQRKAFQRGHPAPDFDTTGSGLGSEAEHGARLGEAEIGRSGMGGLRGMGLRPWPAAAKTDDGSLEDLSEAELDVIRLANIILFPDQYEFYMPTRHNSPDG